MVVRIIGWQFSFGGGAAEDGGRRARRLGASAEDFGNFREADICALSNQIAIFWVGYL